MEILLSLEWPLMACLFPKDRVFGPSVAHHKCGTIFFKEGEFNLTSSKEIIQLGDGNSSIVTPFLL